MLLVVVVEAVVVGVGAPVEGGGGAVEPNGFRSRRGSLLLEEARLTRVASFLLRRKSSRARCEAIVYTGLGVESTGSFNILRVVVGRVAGFANEKWRRTRAQGEHQRSQTNSGFDFGWVYFCGT